MNKKIFDGVIAILSAIGAVYCVFDDVIDVLEVKNAQWQVFGVVIESGTLATILKLILCLSILLFVMFTKKRFSDLFSLLSEMAKNNKLHPLRQMVMITAARLYGDYNQYKVEEANFGYTISKGGGNKCNVRYSLSFKLAKPRLRCIKNKRIFSFYIICDGGCCPSNLNVMLCEHNANTEENTQKNVAYAVYPILDNATIKGKSGDCSPEFSGLYEIKILLPLKLKRIKVNVSYDVKDQILGDETQYSFVISPKNYGNRVRNISVKLDATDVGIDIMCPNIHYIDSSEQIEPAGMFKEKNGIYTLREKIEKPSMNSVYFVQFDISREEKQKRRLNKQICSRRRKTEIIHYAKRLKNKV